MRAGSFSPGLDSTPEETSTMGARVARMASATLSALRPPDRMKGTCSLTPVSTLPIEGRAVSAWPRRSLRGLGVEQDVVDHGTVVEGEARIVGGRHLDGLDDRQVPAAADVNRAVGALIAVQLQHVRADRLHHGVDQAVLGIDQQGHDLGPATRLRGERGRRRRIDAARAGRKEYQADVVGAAGQRRIERGLGFQSADFDLGAHGCRSCL